MAKTVANSKFREWEGLDRISQVAHEMNCIFREISKDDVGIDGEIEIVTPKESGEGYETKGSILKVQAKSGESYIRGNDGSSFHVPVNKSDLEYWYGSTFRTLFIIYHPSDDQLYYKEVKSYVKQTGGDTWKAPFRINFDKSQDKFTPDCRNELAEFAGSSPPRISRGEKERLISNLLPVERIPTVWTAPTNVASRGEVREIIGGWTPPCMVIGNQLYSFENLSLDYAKLQPVIDGQAEKAALQYWWEKEEYRNGYIYMLNQLLGHHEHKCGLKYNAKHGRVYFPCQNQNDDTKKNKEIKVYWDNVRTGRENIERTVVKWYEYGRDRFWRHHAAKLRFVRLGSRWYLRIVPDYFFTTNGEEPFDSERVGSYATRQKHSEVNSTVLNHVLFWSWALTQNEQGTTDRSLITFWLYDNPVLQIRRMPEFGIASFANPYDPSPYDEPTEEPSLFE